MITVKMYKFDLLNLLMDELKIYISDKFVLRLYKEMYRRRLNEGCFDYEEFDVRKIIHKDYIQRNVYLIDEDDTEFSEILGIYKKQGLGECECDICSCIEAAEDEPYLSCFLVRKKED